MSDIRVFEADELCGLNLILQVEEHVTVEGTSITLPIGSVFTISRVARHQTNDSKGVALVGEFYLANNSEVFTSSTFYCLVNFEFKLRHTLFPFQPEDEVLEEFDKTPDSNVGGAVSSSFSMSTAVACSSSSSSSSSSSFSSKRSK